MTTAMQIDRPAKSATGFDLEAGDAGTRRPMLIVNADDWGRSVEETDAALSCFRAGRVSSVSAMVFMKDSGRAAELANEHGVDAGLHLNLSQPCNGPSPSKAGTAAHERLVRYLKANRFAMLVYHPWLRQDFRAVYQMQMEEFMRRFGKAPSHVDGHQHRHLCANMIFDEVIPRGQRVRRNFTFTPDEKGPLNRGYRRWVDRRLAARYRLTDYLFNLAEYGEMGKLARVFDLARSSRVELETHPAKEAEYTLLMSDTFRDGLQGINMAPYARL
jgi:chitin disaccharide deacetylase